MQAFPFSFIEEEQRMVWNPAYHVQTVDDKQVYLFSEHEKFLLRGKAYVLLAPWLLEGQLNADQLVEKLSSQVPAEQIWFALNTLAELHHIQANLELLPKEIREYCGLLNIDEKQAHERLSTTTLYLYDLDGKDNLALEAQLNALLIRTVKTREEADFTVVIAHDYLQKEIEIFAQKAWEKNHPWLLVKLYGSEIWIGPFFEANASPCYTCLQKRIHQNRLEENYIQKKKGYQNTLGLPKASLDCTLNLGKDLLGIEIFKRILTGRSVQLAGKIQTFNTLNFERQEHCVLHYPACPLCAQNTLDKEMQPLQLKSREKKEMQAVNGFRCATPEETLKKYSFHISPLVGIVRYLKPAPNALTTFHTYLSGSNFACSAPSQEINLHTLRSLCGGKGISETAAKASGLCEALERASGEYIGCQKSIKATFQELGPDAIHPHTSLLFSEHQYKNRDLMNPQVQTFSKVMSPFEETCEIDWTPFWSLSAQAFKYFPTSCSYFRYFPKKNEWYGVADSNGCAAGNCLEEAILQGFFELVERDGVAIWWYNRLKMPQVNLTSFNNRYIESLLQDYSRLGREVWVLDLTNDLKIPVFVAVSRKKNSAQENIFMGLGSHLDVETALIRALTEMNQMMDVCPLLDKTLAGEGKQAQIDLKSVVDWAQNSTLENQPYLQPNELVKSKEDYPKIEHQDLLEDIHFCQQVVEELGMEMLVLDQTRSDIGLNVARVLVPGLRHFWARFAPGRLYTVPVKMQWLEQSKLESELNPIHMFL
ncbi:MAG: hypothetical protein S4CHLAM123_04920 [Chlamydiales bacterium]|nr:hypothetical protein [Chlamydiales bacterium]